MSTSRNSARAAGLGALLSAPTPPASDDPEFAAHQARSSQDDADQPQADTGAAKPAKAAQAAKLPARTARTGGALAQRGGPAVLPRKRTQRIPRDKLTVQVPVAVLDGLDALITRDDTRKYDEVEEALRKHLADKGIELDEG